jgi:integrase
MVRLGLRPGEAAGFYWSDLDGSVLHVRHGLRRSKGGGTEVVDSLKTSNSERRLDLPDDLLAMLHRHRKEQARERLAARRWEDDRLMFASTVGTPVDSNEVKVILGRLADRLDLLVDDPTKGPRRPLPYELRHSVASLLIDRGASSVEVADLLGNSERIVAEVYRHRTRPSVDLARRLDWRTAQGE